MTAPADCLTPDDLDVLRHITAGKDAKYFTQLFDLGTVRPHQAPSEGLVALAYLVAAYTTDDAQVRRLVEASACAPVLRTARPGALAGVIDGARAYNAAHPPTPDGAASTERWHFYTDAELLALPEPPWLVPATLFQGGLTLLYGLKGTYKSFVALTLASMVAFTTGPVVYVIAEGKGNFGRRVKALRGQLAGKGHPLYYVTVPVNLYDGDVARFLGRVQAELDPAPVLYVFDTLARSTAGAEENSNRDMGLVVAAAQTLQATGAAVLLVHHTGKDGLDARGASALRNAADIVCKLEKGPEVDGAPTTVLTYENTKDLREPAPLAFALKDWHGSLVAVALSDPLPVLPAKDRRPTLDEQRSDVVKLCWDRARTKDELAADTGRSIRWLAAELPVLVAAGRLKASKRKGRGGELEYLATRAPIDTV